MINEAEKQLAKQRDLAMEQLGEQQIQAMAGLTEALETLTEAIENRTITGGVNISDSDFLGT
jgi:hypothetical protein